MDFANDRGFEPGDHLVLGRFPVVAGIAEIASFTGVFAGERCFEVPRAMVARLRYIADLERGVSRLQFGVPGISVHAAWMKTRGIVGWRPTPRKRLKARDNRAQPSAPVGRMPPR